jgi:hypothetical protein
MSGPVPYLGELTLSYSYVSNPAGWPGCCGFAEASEMLIDVRW